jgi:hypothetical protein
MFHGRHGEAVCSSPRTQACVECKESKLKPVSIDSCYRDIFEQLTVFATKWLRDQHAASSEYLVFRDNRWTVNIKRQSYTVMQKDITNPPFYTYMVSKFDRTRVVYVHDVEGRFFLNCTCQYFERNCPTCLKCVCCSLSR